jgi:hypothetical protein
VSNTARIKSNTDWTVSVTDADGILDSYTPKTGSANTSGADFTYTFKANTSGRVQFTFTSNTTDKTCLPVSAEISIGASVASRFARSNIVLTADGRLIFNDGSSDAERSAIKGNAQGLYFQWGSLIGLNSQGKNNDRYKAEMIVFQPSEYTGTIDAWSAIPETYNEAADDSDKDMFWSKFTTEQSELQNPVSGAIKKGYSLTAGLGDICRYISDKGWVEGYWRMPKQSEFVDLYEQTPQINYTSFNGYKSGSFADETVTVSGGMWSINSYIFLGAEVTDKVTIDNMPEDMVVLPASGGRYSSNGVLFHPGLEGDYWSSSPGKDSFGYGFTFHNTKVFPLADTDRNYALPIRCIKE